MWRTSILQPCWNMYLIFYATIHYTRNQYWVCWHIIFFTHSGFPVCGSPPPPVRRSLAPEGMTRTRTTRMTTRSEVVRRCFPWNKNGEITNAVKTSIYLILFILQSTFSLEKKSCPNRICWCQVPKVEKKSFQFGAHLNRLCYLTASTATPTCRWASGGGARAPGRIAPSWRWRSRPGRPSGWRPAPASAATGARGTTPPWPAGWNPRRGRRRRTRGRQSGESSASRSWRPREGLEEEEEEEEEERTSMKRMAKHSEPLACVNSNWFFFKKKVATMSNRHPK